LIHSFDDGSAEISNKAHPFCRDSEDWGWPCFIALSLLTEESGFLKNGTLEIRVAINILYSTSRIVHWSVARVIVVLILANVL